MVTLFDEVDPRLREALRSEFARRSNESHDPLPRGVTIVLAGHRGAGKSHLLPHVARLLGRRGVDLDHELAQCHGRSLREWVTTDERGFRQAEREVFSSLPGGLVVSVGGGFLSKHPDLLRARFVVLVPVTFATYCERLRADDSRPRLMPQLPLEDELRALWLEREDKHRAVRTVSVVDFALRASAGARAGRVVTLAPDEDAEAFAWRARHAGADLLEVRTDLTPPTDLRAAARALPLIFSARGLPVPEAWRALATFVDEPIEQGGRGTLASFHAPAPMKLAEVLEVWAPVAAGGFIKHIEPLGTLTEASRLFETRAALVARFGEAYVTVLATGPLALPFRAVLARRNALDYLALDTSWAAAPGQRLLSDAVREWRASGGDDESQRLGVLGCHIAHSRSPRIHQPPFDRIDLPDDVSIPEVLTALRPYYRGFAVTAPFKRAAAKAANSPRGAINTLVRQQAGWATHNSDVDGARATLERLGTREVTVLGDGGVAEALREAAREDYVLRFIQRADVQAPISGTVIWTWPIIAEPPEALRFIDARVAIIAYGAPSHVLARVIRTRGGTPVHLGARWFIAQARVQRRLWRAAS